MPLFSPRHSVWVFPSVPPLCGGISMKTTSRYLIPSRVPLAPELKPQFDSPLPLSIKLSLSLFPPSYILISVLFLRFNCVQEWLSESHPALSCPQLQSPDRDWVWTRWMIYWTLLTARQFFFHTRVVVFLTFSHFKLRCAAAVWDFMPLLLFIDLCSWFTSLRWLFWFKYCCKMK